MALGPARSAGTPEWCCSLVRLQGLSDQVRGLVDAEADLGECLVSAAAEQDVLARGVDVPEAALQGMVGEDRFGAGQAEQPVDRFGSRPHGLVRGQQDEGPLLEARFVSLAGR